MFRRHWLHSTTMTNQNYRISVNSFRGNYFFFEFNLMYCDLWSQYIQVRKLFKGRNYSRAETICGNTVVEIKFQQDFLVSDWLFPSQYWKQLVIPNSIETNFLIPLQVVNSIWFADVADTAFAKKSGRPRMMTSFSVSIADTVFTIVVETIFLVQSTIFSMCIESCSTWQDILFQTL